MKSVAKLNRNGPGVFFSANCLGFLFNSRSILEFIDVPEKDAFQTPKNFHLFSPFAEKIFQIRNTLVVKIVILIMIRPI